ncbi:MAG: pyridoxal-phosphate dependent enzyme [Gemmatimonadota bacterium]
MITIDDVRLARSATRSFLRHTPLEPSPELSRLTGGSVFLKLENQQVTGSFKPRGPFNRLQALTDDEKARGVVAATAGNHGIGLSYAGQRLGVPVHVHIARSADPDKLAMLKRQSAILHFAESFEEAHFNSVRMAREDGLTRVSAYSDPYVIASDGVVGLEILEDHPDIDLIIVPVGGGGLVGGISMAATSIKPGIEVWGVEAARSPTFNTWFRAGETGPVTLDDSIAEGLAGYIEPETLSWPYIKAHVSDMRAASEQELVNGMRWTVTQHRMIIEPSAAAGIAATIKAGTELRHRRIAVVVSGGNVAWDRFRQIVG